MSFTVYKSSAGSGKTFTLVKEYINLVLADPNRYRHILAITFTNKAANEMKERVGHLLPSYGQPRWIGTFHSTCLRILKEFHEKLGYIKDFSIYDDSDQISLLKRVIANLNLDPKKYSPKLVRFHIDRAKNETIDILDYLEHEVVVGDTTLDIVQHYQKALLANQAMDFGDLLGKTLQLLNENSDVLRTLQNRWTRLLIDEYQDTNVIQKLLIQKLAGNQGIVCAVGDEDQSIYAWRGARVENMLTFPDDFSGAEIIKLEQNYRSTKRILDAANSVIQNNAGRRAKTLWTDNPEGDMILFDHAEDDYGESRFVLDQIQKITNDPRNKTSEIAIFYRTHVQSRLLEEECRRRNQNYTVLGGTRFFDRMEIKDTLAYLRFTLNPADNISFLRIVNTPSRGIGKQTLENLGHIAGENELSMFDAILKMPTQKKAEKALYKFHQWFFGFRQDIENKKPEEVTEALLKESGYEKMLENEGTIEAESRLENLQELLRSMEEFSQETQGTLGEYLERVSLISDTDRIQTGAAPIVMMTVHNSKGLEFDHVFMVGMEEGIFPHQRAIEVSIQDELEEERRLCYVAMTRARKQLFLSAASRRHLYKGIQNNPVSRFVGEIPDQYLVRFQPPESRIHRSPRSGRMRSRRIEVDEFFQESYDESYHENYDHEIYEGYRPGTTVSHPEFGEGTIKKCEGNPGNLKITVHFKMRGLKKLALNFCQIEIIQR
ncbi:MAG: UvrD-helicase domain-containing protein [Bdellovibrionales bacterium]|nr:UvrD-helicase domain-containing protein [Bdellovibrionales bacterium]